MRTGIFKNFRKQLNRFFYINGKLYLYENFNLKVLVRIKYGNNFASVYGEQRSVAIFNFFMNLPLRECLFRNLSLQAFDYFGSYSSIFCRRILRLLTSSKHKRSLLGNWQIWRKARVTCNYVLIVVVFVFLAVDFLFRSIAICYLRLCTPKRRKFRMVHRKLSFAYTYSLFTLKGKYHTLQFTHYSKHEREVQRKKRMTQ